MQCGGFRNDLPPRVTTPFPVNTSNPVEVEKFTRGVLTRLYPGASFGCMETAFRDVTRLFAGDHPAYGPNDLRYHNLEHTLQATVCLVEILAGRHATGVEPYVESRAFELAVVSALLHDSGYQKLLFDTEGTGAKYTFFHVLRSCAFAASYLPTIGVNSVEVEQVLGAINCTGPAGKIGRLSFPTSAGLIIGCALTTADYLAQFAAPDYPDKLGALYREFRESDEFMNRSPAELSFSSEQDLADHTPAFWEHFVRPHLDREFQGLYRFLANPYPDGPNRYLQAAEQNIEIIRSRPVAG